MKVARGIFSVITTLALVVTFVAVGLAVCMLPPVTHGLATMFVDDGTSPFSRAQLVQVADATRDYSFGMHDERDLYRVIYQVDAEYKKTITNAGGVVPADFPKLEKVTDLSNLQQMKEANNGASEMYCFSNETVAHLDDCYRLASTLFPVVVIIAAIALVGLVFCGVTGRRRSVGTVLMAAGILLIVVFVGLAVWAFINFNSFFAVFHQVFFSQGNWQFPYDSLLICSLPTPFWMGMGVVCLVVALLLSVLSIVIGKKVRR